MYAVIQTGGKQYKVAVGDYLKIEKLDVEEGSEFTFDSVLLVNGDEGLKVGTPNLDGAKVTATIKSQGRHKKVHIIKFKRRKHHMKKMGHRQYFTEVLITGISAA
ncbi:MAG: 50S ribosomal protein L21 [Cycloclasticus sp.]|nr:50S ribosomal protein L21 [Cycloclasticus sp. 46_83_sub15_T18]OUR83206.1 50S ribosomal protein L21 [Cycloclasticus sp. 46_120_T64]